MQLQRSFWIALQFLTRLPARQQEDVTSADLGRSVLAYPVVGLIIGLILLVLAWAYRGADPFLTAAVLLAVWVVVTGGLHLDGLADSADAWIGGHGDRERTLAIMKDPYCGPMGVVILVLVLLLKFAALVVLLKQGVWLGVLLAPVVARAGVVALFLDTSYVREGGIGASQALHMPHREGGWVLGAVALLLFFCLGWQALVLLFWLALLFFLLRQMMMKRLGGTTGDTAGALVELLEAMLLMVLAF